MDGDRGEPNTGRWAALFGVSSALVAGLVQTVLAYYAVVGFRLDWITWSRQPIVDADLVAFGTGLSVFLLSLIVGMVCGAISWSLAKQGRLRGDPDAWVPERVRGWSEFSFLQSATVAFLLGISVVLIGVLFVRLNPEGVTGQAFFIFQATTATIGGLVAGAFVTRTMANAYAHGKVQQESPGGNVISRVQVWSGRNPVTVVLATLVIVGGTGYGITMIDTDVDVADLLPRGNQHTAAAQNLSSEFQSTFTQQITLQLPTNPSQCRADAERVLGSDRAEAIDCTNVTAEPYVRAMEELYQKILEDEDNPIEHTIGVNSFYKLINWTIEGGQDAPDTAFALPPPEEDFGPFPDPGLGETRYAMIDEIVWEAIPDTVTPILSPTFDQAVSLYLVPTTYEGTSQHIGNAMLDFRDEYVDAVEQGDTTWRVWGEDNPPLFTVDIPVANAHQSKLAQEDFQTLFPLILLVIVLALYFGFRNFTAIGIAATTLLSAAVITYGTMGHLRIPLNTLNLTVLPLILGQGIDYAIHQVTEFAHHKKEGYSDEEALREAGGFAGFAMFIATVTSASGLLVMMISPSLLMAQLGLLAAIAIVSVYLLTIVLIPALLALAPTSEAMGSSFKKSGLITGLARFFSRHRIIVGALVVLLTGLAFVGMQDLHIEEFGEPAQNFPEDDPLRLEHNEGLAGFYNLEEGGELVKTNVIVFEGDIQNIQTHRYIEHLQGQLADRDSLNLDTSRHLPFLVETWMTVKDGGPGAIQALGMQTLQEECPNQILGLTQDCGASTTDNYPQTREEIESETQQVFETPLDTFASMFLNYPDSDITIMTLATTTGTFEDAERAWTDVMAGIEDAQTNEPHGVTVSFVGNTPLNYLFITEQLPWLSYLGIIAALALALLAILFTKAIRPTLTILGIVGLTSVWWLGSLPTFDIGLAITLMLPAVFITSIGSDYAVHMTWNMVRNPDREEVYGVVGKAILFSAITTIGAFLVFTQTQNVAAAQAMLATVIAIGIIFLATLLIMPLFYPLTETEEDEPEADPQPPPQVPPATRITMTTPEDADTPGPNA